MLARFTIVSAIIVILALASRSFGQPVPTPQQQLSPSEFALQLQQGLANVANGVGSLAQAAEQQRKTIDSLQAELARLKAKYEPSQALPTPPIAPSAK